MVVQKELKVMKVIYEYDLDRDDRDDINDLKMVQIGHDMYIALWDIQAYIRSVNKGWNEDDKEKILDTISDFILESKIHEIE